LGTLISRKRLSCVLLGPHCCHELLVASAPPGNRLDNDLAVRQESYAALSHRDLKCPTIA
jgi:hypothetical protein